MDQQPSAVVACRTMFKKYYLHRASSFDFLKMLPQLEANARPAALAPVTLARALLDVGVSGESIDPRLPLYLEALLDTDRINILHLLVATTQFADPSHLDSTSLDAADILQSRLLRLMTKRIANGTVDSDTVLLTFLSELRPWMSQHPASATLGMLVSTTLSSPATQHAITGTASRKFKASFGRDLTPLISSLSSTNIQLASALSYYQKQYDLRDDGFVDGSLNILDGVDMAALSFQDTVMDNEPIITRAGLYVYLNAMVRLHWSPNFPLPVIVNSFRDRERWQLYMAMYLVAGILVSSSAPGELHRDIQRNYQNFLNPRIGY